MEEMPSNTDTRLSERQVAADISQHQIPPDKSSKGIKQKAQEQNESIRRGARSFAKKIEALAKCNEDLINSLETDYVSRNEHDELKKQLENTPLISHAEHEELKTALEQAQQQSKNLKLHNDEREAQSKLELEKAAAEIKSLSTLVDELHKQLKDAKAAKRHALAKLKSIFTEIDDSDDEQVPEVASLTTRPKVANTEQDHQVNDIALVEGVHDTSKEADPNVVALSVDDNDANISLMSAEHGQNLPGNPNHDPPPTLKQDVLAATDHDRNKDQDVNMDTSPSSSTMVHPQQRVTPLVVQEDAQSDQMCDGGGTATTRLDDTATQFQPRRMLNIARSTLPDATPVKKSKSGLFGGQFGTPSDADSVFGRYDPATKTFKGRLSLSRSPVNSFTQSTHRSSSPLPRLIVRLPISFQVDSPDNSFTQSTHRSSSPLPRLIVRLPVSIQVDNISPTILPADISTKLLSVSHDNKKAPEKYKPFIRPLSTKEHLEDRMWENARTHEQEVQRRRTKADLEKQLAKQSSAQAARAILASIPGFSESPDFVPFDSPSTNAQAKTSAVPPMERPQNAFDEHDHGLTTPTGSLILRLDDYTNPHRVLSTSQDQAERHTSPIDLDITRSTHEQAQWQRAVQDATTPNDPSRPKAPSSPRSSRLTKVQAGSRGSSAATLPSATVRGAQPARDERHTRSPSLEVVSDRKIIPEVKSTAASTLHSSPKTIIKSEPNTQSPWVLKPTLQSLPLKRKYDATYDPQSNPLQSKRRYDATYDPRSDSQAHAEKDDAARDPRRLCDISTVVPDSPPKPASGTRTPHFSLPHFSSYAPSYPPWSSKWSFTSWNGNP